MPDENCFVDKVKRTFAFLQSEFGFRVTREGNSPMLPLTDGAVDYSSSNTVVTIDSEMGCASMYFYRLQDGRQYYLTPIDIHEYLSTSESDKELLLSTNPADAAAATALFNKTFLLNQPDWRGGRLSRVDLEHELRNLAGWLQTHGGSWITGDFSRWPRLYEYKIRRARAELLRRGEDEQVNALIKGPDGKFMKVKQSTFKKDYEYIEKLKKEFSS